jgi:hypothetical protein
LRVLTRSGESRLYTVTVTVRTIDGLWHSTGGFDYTSDHITWLLISTTDGTTVLHGFVNCQGSSAVSSCPTFGITTASADGSSLHARFENIKVSSDVTLKWVVMKITPESRVLHADITYLLSEIVCSGAVDSGGSSYGCGESETQYTYSDSFVFVSE